MKLETAAVLIWTLSVAGCEQDPTANLSSPREFFQKERIGSSPDHGIIKFHNIEDHVATIHGFADDGDACEKVVAALNADACAETDGEGCLNPFSCYVIN